MAINQARVFLISTSEEILTDIYLHEVNNLLNKLSLLFKLRHEDVSELEWFAEDELNDLEEYKEDLEDLRNLLKQDRQEGLEEKFDKIKEYEREFSREIGESVDALADCTRFLTDFFSNYNESDFNTVEQVLSPINEYDDMEVRYGVNRDQLLKLDGGVRMAIRSVAEDGLKHGKDEIDNSDDYEMIFNVEDLGDHIGVEIKDNGPGTDYSEDELFRKGEGDCNGHGMYLTRELIESQDGQITLDENYSEGIRFEVQLPKAYPITAGSFSANYLT